MQFPHLVTSRDLASQISFADFTDFVGKPVGQIGPRITGYFLSVGAVGLITAVGIWIDRGIAAANMDMLYVLAVSIASLLWGRGPALVCSLASALAFNGLFSTPYGRLVFRGAQDLIPPFTLLAIGFIISSLSERMRREARAARTSEAYIAALYRFGETLSSTTHLDQIVEIAGRSTRACCARPVAILLSSPGGLTLGWRSPEFQFDDDERAAAAKAVETGQEAGRNTRTSASAKNLYLPLATPRAVQGVLGIAVDQPPAGEVMKLLGAIASRTALAIENAQTEEKAKQIRLLQDREKIEKALLSTISHNLRTPLASITGVFSTLLEDRTLLDAATNLELLETGHQEAARLNRLVRNLLDMTRLQAGALPVRKSLCDARDVISSALEQLGERARRREIVLDLAPNVGSVNMDFVLISQVIVNLVDNALKYSPDGQPIEIRAQETGHEIQWIIADRGPGLGEDKLEQMFKMFERAGRTGESDGLGLGLSICQGFVEAHGGRIRAELRPQGGLAVIFTLPVLAAEAG